MIIIIINIIIIIIIIILEGIFGSKTSQMGSKLGFLSFMGKGSVTFSSFCGDEVTSA